LSSVLDEVRTVQEHIVSRLAELRPLVAEYHELERIAKRLEVDTSQLPEIAKPKARAKPKAAAKPKARPKRAAKAKPASSNVVGTREKGAQRREQILDLIRTRPGITVPDLSVVLGIDPPPLYRVVRKLQADGVVTKSGKELRLT
jgi:hypothetical protein